MQQATQSTTQGLAAFKEWAVSCDALGQGRQVMIFRKGGIKEKGHVFKMEHPHFFLYPTFEHQDSESIKAAYQPLLASALAAKPELGEVSIRYWAQVDEAWALSSMDPVLAQKDNHIYSDQSVKDRWEWAPAKPLWLLLLRVYKLETPLNLEVLEEYTGCKSWIDLAQLPASASGLPCSPVLDDAAYAAMAAKVRGLVPGAQAGVYKISFTKSGRTVDCPPNRTALEAAQEAGLENLPYSCQGGTCKTCAVKGEGEMETEEMLALTPTEIQAGWRLTCVAYPRGDCKFDL